MVKFFKRTLYVILGLIALGATWLYVESNSEKFATDMVYLECTIDEISDLDKYRNRPKIIHGRLRDDWINDKVLLNWVADGGFAENGLEDTEKLNVSTNFYSGYDYKHNIQRSFNRDTLEYGWESKTSSAGEIEYWHTRQCEIIEKRVFEAERKKSAAATKAKQKI